MAKTAKTGISKLAHCACLHSERFEGRFAVEVIKGTGGPIWLLLHASIKATLFQTLALLASAGKLQNL